jgi:hypothetical protein
VSPVITVTAVFCLAIRGPARFNQPDRRLVTAAIITLKVLLS